MNFLQRLKNVIVFWMLKGLNTALFKPLLVQMKAEYGIKPEKSLAEVFDDKELTLFMSDFAYEYPQPMRPDYKSIGPVSIQPVQPLPSCLRQEIKSSGDDGAIIVSFGSNVASVLDKDKVDIMAEAFGRLKQKVIWRLQGYKPSSLCDNIIVRDWIPQNDLLANEKLRAFVSHVGMNGMYETLYYGVPVVAIPLYADQFDNTAQMVEKGVALTVDYNNLTVDDLYNKIQRVIHEPRC
ncbi:2-hydroxyacylsphingosine 1-beta-galactosyltransferase [Exaiptasia diaphana]|nr:2-hydroxyacylsphingosine 1-beta-galactosyltransferase [Exaiptasia diaphana]